MTLSGPATLQRIHESSSRNRLARSLLYLTVCDARVPEGVPLAPRLEHPVSFPRNYDFVSKQSTQGALKDEGVFILAMVAVQRSRERSRRYRMVNNRKSLTTLIAVNLPSDAEPSKIESLADASDNCGCHLLCLTLIVTR